MHTNPNPGAAQVGKGARGTGRRRAGVCPERGGTGEWALQKGSYGSTLQSDLSTTGKFAFP